LNSKVANIERRLQRKQKKNIFNQKIAQRKTDDEREQLLSVCVS